MRSKHLSARLFALVVLAAVFRGSFLMMGMIFLAACEKSSQKGEASAPPTAHTGMLHGQVFIVTQGGESIKLALTEIKLYKPSDIELAKAEYREANDERQEAFKRREEELLKRRDNFRQELDALKQTYAVQGEDSPELRGKIADLQIKVEGAQIDTAQLNKDKQKDDSLFFQHLQNPFATATTDADGKFDISVPANERFAIAAMNHRRVGGDTEKYFWLVWVSLDGQGSKTLMLSNRNLITGTDPDNVL